MRRKFSPAELRVLERVADAYQEQKKNWDNDMALMETIRSHVGLKGNVTSGSFRVALITKKLVFKLPYRGSSTVEELKSECRFIQKMKLSEFSRHFPLTTMIGPVMMQERIKQIGNITLNIKWDVYVEVLGKRLGIKDIHDHNYGWAGRKSAPWPVFIDVDFRKRPKKFPSWLRVAA